MKEAEHGDWRGHKKAAILIDGLQFLGPLSYKHVFGKPLFAYICKYTASKEFGSSFEICLPSQITPTFTYFLQGE